jgi:methionine-rich copper-binding protein CopC
MRAALSAAALLLILAVPVLGHAQLTTADPGPDAVITTVPAELVADFSQNLDPDSSSLELRDSAGEALARGVNDPTEPRVMRMTLPDLASGMYEVRWTTLSTEDGELARGTYTFMVEPAALSPSLSSAVPSPSAEPGNPEPSASASAAPSEAANPSPSSPPSVDGSTGSGGEVLLPLAVVGLLIVGLGVWLVRTRR